MRPQGGAAQVAWPRPGRAIISLIAANVVCYVLQLLFVRANVTFVADLMLTPAAVFERGYVWQPVTYWWLHAEDSPFHLLINCLFLWMFGSPLERWWGTKRVLVGYAIFGLSGGALTLLVGLLSKSAAFGPLLGGFWFRPHLGASGAVMGMTVAWGLTFANQEMHFLLLGRMKGKTFVLIIIAVELLVALSVSPVSSTSHFGGMIGAAILCRGLWRPSKWQELWRRNRLQAKKKKIESQLKVIEGGRGRDDDDPKKKGGGPPTVWN